MKVNTDISQIQQSCSLQATGYTCISRHSGLLYGSSLSLCSYELWDNNKGWVQCCILYRDTEFYPQISIFVVLFSHSGLKSPMEQDFGEHLGLLQDTKAIKVILFWQKSLHLQLFGSSTMFLHVSLNPQWKATIDFFPPISMHTCPNWP